MSRNLHTEEMDRLFDGILTLQSREEAYRFFEDLCTAGELEAMQQRFEVASMLRDKNTYSEIADKTGASTATISRVNRALLYGDDGYELVIKRLEEK
ncbi:MAG: YerC/YecD family TrpR-related protein [Lachnospiraceae bacterium]|jgi:TrpR-related protein YerC/YecD|nr:TrpR YerC/YecD [Lachnospiraceae bacterium]MDD5957135.1 YerC/YecD family TrpR-related protein [Lachnospiraceae bacterium]MDY3991177.1 YerC/YecD family TrpR-related protein [Lachnospiraceae bacterium]